MSDDLVSRQIAKDAICNACGKIDCDQMDTCEMLKLPSAQPVAKDINVPINDCISRQSAIDALRTCYDTETITMDNGDEYINYGDAIGEIEQLPSAQPEKRTEERTETHGVCLDAIDRQVAIDTLHNEIVRRRINEDSIDDGALDEFDTEAILRRLPSAQPEQHWIPCSERLPKKNGFYLCATKDCITILEFIEGNPHYHEEPSFVSDVLGKCNSYVVAWMPLPEPYREGADE